MTHVDDCIDKGRWVSSAEAAKRLGVRSEVVRLWVALGLVGTRIYPGGIRPRVDLRDVERVILESVTPGKSLAELIAKG